MTWWTSKAWKQILKANKSTGDTCGRLQNLPQFFAAPPIKRCESMSWPGHLVWITELRKQEIMQVPSLGLNSFTHFHRLSWDLVTTTMMKKWDFTVFTSRTRISDYVSPPPEMGAGRHTFNDVLKKSRLSYCCKFRTWLCTPSVILGFFHLKFVSKSDLFSRISVKTQHSHFNALKWCENGGLEVENRSYVIKIISHSMLKMLQVYLTK